MYEKFIENYINNATLGDLIYYANKNNIFLPQEDAKVIYNYGKKYWKIIYKGNPTELFNHLKNKLTPETYNKMIDLYNNYKKKYKDKF